MQWYRYTPLSKCSSHVSGISSLHPRCLGSLLSLRRGWSPMVVGDARGELSREQMKKAELVHCCHCPWLTLLQLEFVGSSCVGCQAQWQGQVSATSPSLGFLCWPGGSSCGEQLQRELGLIRDDSGGGQSHLPKFLCLLLASGGRMGHEAGSRHRIGEPTHCYCCCPHPGLGPCAAAPNSTWLEQSSSEASPAPAGEGGEKVPLSTAGEGQRWSSCQEQGGSRGVLPALGIQKSPWWLLLWNGPPAARAALVAWEQPPPEVCQTSPIPALLKS